MNQLRNIISHILGIICLFSSVVVSGQTIRINEIMPSNSTTIQDEDDDFSDWIELYNPGPTPITLLNWSLTDDAANIRKWIFPDITLGSDEYLIIYASDKDRTGQELHTNFKLATEGEYLALTDALGDVVSTFDPNFPPLGTDISLAFDLGDFIPTSTPTPGAENVFSFDDGVLPGPTFSHSLGFYDVPIDVSISSLPGFQIMYTTDGSLPTGSNGLLYQVPVTINTTTVLRAAVVQESNVISKVGTQTYLFLNDVINQSNSPAGYPSTWGQYAAIPGTAIADYEMDPEITQDPTYGAQLKDALRAIPTMSLVTDPDNLFSKTNNENMGGIYIFTGAPGTAGTLPGRGWERPASLELFGEDGTKKFEINCGVRLQGGHSRRSEKSPKHSFRIVFKNEYGPSRLEYPLFGDTATTSFNAIILRAGFGNMIYHWLHGERIRMQHVRDLWAKDTQLALGYVSGHGRYVHLYINGLYWGLYNPTEHISEEFLESYFGGDEENYDIIKDEGELVAGTRDTWDNLLELAELDLSNDANYQRLLGNKPNGHRNPGVAALIDAKSLADYMLLNFYGGNTDWDHHNWIAVQNRQLQDKGFEFLSWDAEHILENISTNTVNEDNIGRPSHIFQRMLSNANFRNLFADRVQQLCFNGGVLTPEASTSRWLARSNQIKHAIVAESARWGDYRRDVHPFGESGPFQLYTPEDWTEESTFLLEEYFPARTNILIQQLRAAGMFPAIEAPSYLINDSPIKTNTIQPGDILKMTASESIFYTMDGSDPKEGGTLYTGPLTLNASTNVKARTRNGSLWSALSNVVLFVTDDLSALKLTEIHYHPQEGETHGDQDLEFIELKNTAPTPIDLGGIVVSGGIQYRFPYNTFIPPGGFIVLASHRVAFFNRYGFSPFGEFTGQLANGGDAVTLNRNSGILFSVVYDDISPWPEDADGKGYSLVPINFNPLGNQNMADQWRVSLYKNGSPGRDDDLVTAIAENGHEPIVSDIQNFPNPFTTSTTVSYTLHYPCQVELKIFDVLGREITTLINQFQEAGGHAVQYAPADGNKGVYVYHLKIGGQASVVGRMIRIN
jgi:hypothetical protein